MFEGRRWFSGPNVIAAGEAFVLQRNMFATLNKLPCFCGGRWFDIALRSIFSEL